MSQDVPVGKAHVSLAQLNDRSPACTLREGELDEVGPAVIAAARAFLIGG